MLRLRFAALSMTSANTPLLSVMLSAAKHLIPKKPCVTSGSNYYTVYW